MSVDLYFQEHSKSSFPATIGYFWLRAQHVTFVAAQTSAFFTPYVEIINQVLNDAVYYEHEMMHITLNVI